MAGRNTGGGGKLAAGDGPLQSHEFLEQRTSNPNRHVEKRGA